MCINPRKRFGIEADAGMTVFDLDKEYTVDPAEFVSMGKYTPFEGEKVTGRCVLTAVNGRLAWLDKEYCR